MPNKKPSALPGNGNSATGRLTARTAWEGRRPAEAVTSIPFQEVFHQHLQPSPGKTCLEIGCVPGRFLAYICRNFGYHAEGIDYAKDAARITGATLRNNGIDDFIIHEADFLEWIPPRQYDLVCSFGFIEHFAGGLNQRVIAAHVDALKDDGILFLEVPNFRLGQYLIHRALDPEKFAGHELDTMKLSYYRKIIRDFNLQVRFLGYAGGFFDYWTSNRNPTLWQRRLLHVLDGLKGMSARVRILQRLNNRFLSPVLILIAEKSGATG